MAKNQPSLQFYPQDFLGGVMLLDEEAVGVYIKLLCALWIVDNRLPFDFKKLARASNTPPKTLERVWPEIQDKFEVASNVLSHPRFTRDLAILAKRRASGSLGGRAKEQARQSSEQDSKQGSESSSKSLANEKQKPNKVVKNEIRRTKNEDCINEEQQKPRKRFIPPTVEEVRDYCKEQGYTLTDPELFVGFYGSKNWMVGSNKMVHWRKAVSGWEAREKKQQAERQQPRHQDLPRSVKNEIAARQMKEAARKRHCEQQRIEDCE